ncbi:hypothetical protein ACPPVT_12545 [Angustibacter sp. McL0619]|uniref:hypothetical protein n=1 Tax=Angustibacter sp. McL0619 TaxID=3415676 RepID=UPI003CF30183
MAIEEGHFRLYTHVVPALKAGDYRFASSQGLRAKDAHNATVPADQLPVQDLATHVRVTSPRYLLPPDQVLSTYPPAGTEGAYGSRLPQVVIKRRTLPWERAVDAGTAGTPWLALVVYAEGEAEVLKNVPVAQCVSPGVKLDGVPEVAKGSCLEIRTSMVERIMPTRKDVPLLAHAREVNIDDTELMLGDDDGFLAVVVSNRLPLAARNPDGTETPVKYHAVLVSLEGLGQFSALLPTSPPAKTHTDHLVIDLQTAVYAPADYDNQVMDSAYPQRYPLPAHVDDGRPAHARGAPAEPLDVNARRAVVSPDAVTSANSGSGSWTLSDVKYANQVSVDATTVIVAGDIKLVDPKLRFPALLHWTFTTIGDRTFELLMRDADSGLLGTLGQAPQVPIGRPPLEVVETGHVGLDQRTYRGDGVRAWYRGPGLPHPADLDSPRLPLAHTGDQLRAVIPDGREDISLAAAFEIGRLLALSQPSMVASLLRWRQLGYQAARIETLWTAILVDLDLAGVELAPGRLLGTHFGRALARTIAGNPAETVGLPRELCTPGSPMSLDGDPIRLVTKGFGIDVGTDVPLGELLDQLRVTEVPRKPGKLSTAAGRAAMARALEHGREASLAQLVAGALADDQPDALDRALAGRRPEQEDER